MSCYSPHPDKKDVSCWHGKGHEGNHGKFHMSWPNLDDPVQKELAALREVAEMANSYLTDGSCHGELVNALSEAGYA